MAYAVDGFPTVGVWCAGFDDTLFVFGEPEPGDRERSSITLLDHVHDLVPLSEAEILRPGNRTCSSPAS
jgi:hypothetical protein